MLTRDYFVRLMQPTEYKRIGEICRAVYPHEARYTPEELADHDPESANWAAVIQWVNPVCPPPPAMALR